MYKGLFSFYTKGTQINVLKKLHIETNKQKSNNKSDWMYNICQLKKAIEYKA